MIFVSVSITINKANYFEDKTNVIINATNQQNKSYR